MIEARNAGRSLGRSFSLTAATAAFLAVAAPAALLAFAPSAQAQGLFSFFGGGPSPYDIERRLDAAGYALTGPLIRRGDVYLADVVIGRHDLQRLVIDAQTGRIMQRYRVQPARWRDAPRNWNTDADSDDSGPGLLPPENLTRPAPRDQIARDEDPALGTGAPRTTWSEPVTQPDKPKPKPHEARRKSEPLAKIAPVAKVAPPAKMSGPSAESDASAGQSAAVPRAPSTAASRPAGDTAKIESPRSAVAPSVAAATKTDEHVAAKSSPAVERTDAKGTSKSKTVNDIPVTPLD